MKILLLGPEHPRLEEYLAESGDEVVRCEKRLTRSSIELKNVDFVVSYGYRYILKDSVLKRFPNRAVNLHISYLPFNRGADPNLWSWLEDTPKGVSIHYLDAGVDTGGVLAQRQMHVGTDETLRTSYEKLTEAIEDLFVEIWPGVKAGEQQAEEQPLGGSYHRLADKEPFVRLLRNGWDTPVAELVGKAKAPRLREVVS